MATSGEKTTVGELSQEATCPLCLEFFNEPMVLSCGHNFCRDCLAQLGAEASCPQCRAKVEPGSACPNRTLGNMVCLVKSLRLSEGAQEESSDQWLCQEHGKPLQSFCSQEKSLLCPGCLEGHQGHPLLSLPEAAQEYKDQLDGLLKSLRKEEQELLEQRQAEEKSLQECQEKFATEKEKVGLALESLQELLRERQLVWLGWLAEQKEKMEAEQGVTLARLSREASRLQQLMAQTERKCRQPDGEFLQDIQDTVDRWSTERSTQNYRVEHRVNDIHGLRLQDRASTVLKTNASVRQIVDDCKDSLRTTLTRENLEELLATKPSPEVPQTPRWRKVYVMPNSSTAQPWLQCQRSSVCRTNRHQRFPEAPERFDRGYCVLGCEGFTTGWRWWEVTVQEADDVTARGKDYWAVGVAKESVRRKGSFQLRPDWGIWAVGNYCRENIAFSKGLQPLGLQRPLRRLRVRLDCEAGKVEFLDVETEISLYTFWTGPFHGETLRPFFCLAREGVTLQCEEFPQPIKGIRDG